MKLLGIEPTDPILIQDKRGESNSDKEVCMARRIKIQAGEIRRVLEVADMGFKTEFGVGAPPSRTTKSQ